ncbi:MAG TPA: hypothetical protein VLT59_08110, partial [Steroidobacteraceae bacterium]|nr:hypothetical protein [Steroidobacteraceae bacterium]
MSARAAASIASGGQVRTEIVDDAAGFQELEPLWRRLERESTARSPCQRWDWARLWWRHYAGRGDRPWIVLVRLDDEIVGLGPLYVRDAGRRWGRRLRFIATGEPEESEVASEFLDVLAAPAHRALAGRAVAAAIARSDQWREMELRNVLESSTIATHRDAAGPQVGQRSRGLRYTVRLDESWDAYLSR